MEKTRTLFTETRRFKDDTPVRTELTLDFSNLTDEDIFEMATDSAVIKWQANARRNALKAENAVPIPVKATYTVPKPGTRATGEVSVEKAMATILKRAGGDVAKAMEMLAAMAKGESSDPV